MPNRVLREGILTSERIAALSPMAELFYRRLMSVVDDYGRYPAHPTLLRSACWPLAFESVTDQQVTEWLTECAQNACGMTALVTVYRASGNQYLQITDFRQRFRAKKSKYPAPKDDRHNVSHDDGHDDGHDDSVRRSRRRETETYSETKTEAKFDAIPGWERFAREYKGEVVPDRDLRVWLAVILTQADQDLLFENLPAWNACRKARDGFLPNAKNFLFEGYWKTKPPADPETKQERISREADEINERQRLEKASRAITQSPVIQRALGGHAK